MIVVKEISFAYGFSPVIENLSFEFEAGRFYSILGPNGCGKTTLLDLLIGHLKPQSGKVVLGNNNILSMSKRDIAKQISLVSQNYNINFPFTVKEVVMMGRHPYIGRFAQPSSEDVEIVNRVMERTGTDRFAERKVTDLSGGERQRCVFARALSQDTPLLCLDEAFANMDISHTIRLLDLVKKEVRERNRTVISVFHDINIAAIWSDLLIFMKDGKVAASGETEDIMCSSIIEDVFHVKSEVMYNSYSGTKQAHFRATYNDSSSIESKIRKRTSRQES
ncbi:MAG: ABC transporter ATP-binding protein [Desulfamplus sp.]|nr:ABC transporter ATP-binding protein [Desulfamplus sp.]